MPYERRAMELMKVGRDKRAFKYVKARVCIEKRKILFSIIGVDLF
jgi:hypothetical protein